jgi:hypothetical protein
MSRRSPVRALTLQGDPAAVIMQEELGRLPGAGGVHG